MTQSKFKPEAPFKPGFIGNTVQGELSTCHFGGAGWSATGSRADLAPPALLATVDLASRQLKKSLGFQSNLQIPLFSYVNLDGIIPLQEYEIDHGTKTVAFKPFVAKVQPLADEDRLTIPLPEVTLRLREMRENEIPIDEESYWVAIDSFLGGDAIVRILGSPVYIDYLPTRSSGFNYFASIGYEARPSGLLQNGPFFLGEIAHYFYVSSDWNTVRVVSQAS